MPATIVHETKQLCRPKKTLYICLRCRDSRTRTAGGCTVLKVHVGTSSTQQKSVAPLGSVAWCPPLCDKDCRANTDSPGDTAVFVVTIDPGGNVTVLRQDSTDGWTLNLRIPCCAGIRRRVSVHPVGRALTTGRAVGHSTGGSTRVWSLCGHTSRCSPDGSVPPVLSSGGARSGRSWALYLVPLGLAANHRRLTA